MPSKHRLTGLVLRMTDVALCFLLMFLGFGKISQENWRLPTFDRHPLVNIWPEALFKCILLSSLLIFLTCIMSEPQESSAR